VWSVKTAVLVICALAICGYFLALAGPGLRAGFTTDDLVNLTAYWNQPLAAIVKANVLYFSSAYRPMGAWFYRPMFALAGFSPLPYRVFCFALLIGNLGLLWLAMRSITQSFEIAALSTLIGAFHPQLVDLYWNNGAIYDILCLTFYFGALLYYVRARRAGPILNLRGTAVFIVLYVCALDSKEMAVTLPVVLLLYELIYYPPPTFGASQVGKWAATNCRLAITAGALTVPYIWGKLLPQSLFTQIPAFHLDVTAAQFLAHYGGYLDILFFRDHWFGEIQTAVLLAAMLGIALLLRSRHMAFALSMLLATFLPVAFIPARDAYVLYIPLAGWSLYGAALLVALRDILLPSRKLAGTTQWRQVALFLVVLVLLLRAYRVQRLRMYGELTLAQPAIRSLLAGLDQLHPKFPRGARVLVINDPLPHPYEFLLLLRLYCRDNTLEVDRGNANDGHHQYVMVWRGSALHLIKPAEPADSLSPGNQT
jgi:hypothetical protein